MPSTRAARLSDWLTAPRNVAVFTAILVAVPTSYAFASTVGGGGDFLLLLTLAVGVPQAYVEYWPVDESAWRAAAWVVVACAVATAGFVAVFLAGRRLASLSPLYASVAAFLVVDVGGLAALSWRRR
ncbi:MAG: hypothetical protein ABEJ78_09200 [Haloferacaceae archaeon]